MQTITNDRITPCLWFDGEAEEAANFYVGIFPNSSIKAIAHFGATVEQSLVASRDRSCWRVRARRHAYALNGGPIFSSMSGVAQ